MVSPFIITLDNLVLLRSEIDKFPFNLLIPLKYPIGGPVIPRPPAFRLSRLWG
jgi:hypothetical protein